MIPGEWLLSDEPIEINASRRGLRVSVRNTGDRPIQVGSHFHFFEANRLLDFDRPAALGMRLDVPSGQSVRFEAGDERDVDLVEFGGTGLVVGFNSLLDGATSGEWTVERALEQAGALGFSGMAKKQDTRNRHEARARAGEDRSTKQPAPTRPSGGRRGKRSA